MPIDCNTCRAAMPYDANRVECRFHAPSPTETPPGEWEQEDQGSLHYPLMPNEGAGCLIDYEAAETSSGFIELGSIPGVDRPLTDGSYRVIISGVPGIVKLGLYVALSNTWTDAIAGGAITVLKWTKR